MFWMNIPPPEKSAAVSLQYITMELFFMILPPAGQMKAKAGKWIQKHFSPFFLSAKG